MKTETLTFQQVQQLTKKYGTNWIHHTKEFEQSKLKKGDLFYTSWGYDQTNYDYIAIMEVSPTGKTVKCQRTSHFNTGTSGTSNVQQPIFQPFGEVFRLQVRKYSYTVGEISLVGSYPFLHTGEGSKRKGYFSRVEPNREYYETMSQFGH